MTAPEFLRIALLIFSAAATLALIAAVDRWPFADDTGDRPALGTLGGLFRSGPP